MKAQHNDMLEIKTSLSSLDDKFVDRRDFSLVKTLVYGAAAMILIAVFGAFIISVVPHATIVFP